MARSDLMDLIHEGRRLNAIARAHSGKWPRDLDAEDEPEYDVVLWCERNLPWLLDSLEAFIATEEERQAKADALQWKWRLKNIQIDRLCRALQHQKDATGLIPDAERVLDEQGIPASERSSSGEQPPSSHHLASAGEDGGTS